MKSWQRGWGSQICEKLVDPTVWKSCKNHHSRFQVPCTGAVDHLFLFHYLLSWVLFLFYLSLITLGLHAFILHTCRHLPATQLGCCRRIQKQLQPLTASVPRRECQSLLVTSWLPGAIVIGTPKEREVTMSLTAQGTYVSCPQHTFLAVTGLHVNSGIPHCQPGTFPPHFPQFGVYSFVCSFVCMSVHLSIHFFNVKPTIHPSNAHRAYTGAACFFSFSPGSLRCRKVEGWEGRLWFPCPP